MQRSHPETFRIYKTYGFYIRQILRNVKFVLFTTLREAQSRAEGWFTANRLFLNVDKTEHIVFSTRRLPEDGGVGTVKFLGASQDSGLRWSSHMDSLLGRLASAAFLLRRLSECVSRSTLRHAYFALCQTHINYAILAWGQSRGER